VRARSFPWRTTRRGGALVALSGVGGYLLGTFPSADAASGFATRGRIDLRSAGSTNPGALNAAQQLGTSWGLAVLAADIAKGVLAGLTGRRLAGGPGAYLAATAAIAGHIAPIWTGGRGGKGVATSAGACLAVFPAFFPIDASVAALAAAGTANPESAVRVSSSVWVISALMWWRRGWPNLWGPAPTISLPAFSLTGATMILAKFAHVRRRG
jgi:acyl-phosphate glycerol 3-phosphate acyltransferase